MAYQAIVNGARGLVFFSGHPTDVMSPADARAGWNWTAGQVLFEYVQDPPPPPIDPTKQKFRSVAVTGGAFRDWFGPHDVHVYRFATG